MKRNNLKVLVINQFASTPIYSSGSTERHFYLADKLKDCDIEFTIVSASYNHLFHKFPETHGLLTTESIAGGNFIWVKQRKYKGKSFPDRILSWFEFLIKLFFLPIKKRIKPDVVIVSSMSIFPSLYASYLKKRYKIPFILEIRDIWPLTPMQIGGYSKNHPFIMFMLWLENFAYKNADSIITLLPSFEKHLTNVLGYTKPVFWIPNAIDDKILQDSNTTEIQLPKDKFIVAYTGALGLANAMDCYIDAAKLLVGEKDILLIIVGDGPEKDKLAKRGEGLKNLMFLPKIPKSQVVPFLKQVDVSFLSWQNLEMYNFGVSANKYNDYMLASIPVISASIIPDDPVVLAKCGIQVPGGDVQAIAEAILKLNQMPMAEREKLGKNGYDFVIKNQTYSQIAKKYEICLKETISNFKK